MTQLMKDTGISKYYLRVNGINPNMLDKMLLQGDFGSKTINKVCKLLDCQPCEIMEYVPDEETQESK